MNTNKLISTIAISISLFSTSVFATDAAAKLKLEDAKKAYAERADLKKVEEGLTATTDALKEAEDKDLKYDILVLTSKLHYSKGMQTAGDEKKVDIFEAGRAAAEAARKLGDHADAFYWEAANLARWGEAKGVLQALAKKNDLLKLLAAVPEKTSRDGGEGEKFEGYGSARISGRIYFKLPAFAGGNPEKALELLKSAYEGAKDYGLNINYYAEALYAADDVEKKKEAKKILDAFLKENPEKYNLNRIPETKQEYADAKKLRAEMAD